MSNIFASWLILELEFAAFRDNNTKSLFWAWRAIKNLVRFTLLTLDQSVPGFPCIFQRDYPQY